MALMSRGKETGGAADRGLADDTHRYWAFLSYSHADSADADWLHQAIERFVVPKALVGRVTAHGAVPKRLTPIFRDRHELAASSDLGGKIRAAIKQSRYLMVLCSPAAAQSRWVNEEILAFKKLHGERRILAAIVGGEPWASEIAGREGEECFPPALREKIDRKGQSTGKRAEPIAADLRVDRDGRETGKLKLVAGMLGLGLDDLVKREQQRRQKRLTYVAAASLAGMTVASGLAVFAFDKRDEARDQRREAEGLVGFMLGDLRDELEPIGKLRALDAVGTRALQYFEKQDKAELGDAALAQRSRALNLLGQISKARANPDAALARYREARRSTAELVERAPNDPQRLFDHAQNVFWIGEIARLRGQAAQAELEYREYKRLADRMVAADPGNPKWQMEVLYADENLGINLYNQRRFVEAGQIFRRAIKPMQSLAANDPGNADYQKEYSTLLAWLADTLRSEGRFELAITARQQQLSFLNQLIARGRTDVVFREHLIPAYQALGNLLAAKGDYKGGAEQLRLAVAEADRLIPIEPDNAFWRGLAAQARLDLAKTLIEANRPADAAVAESAGCSDARRVLARDSSPTWRSLQTACLSVRSRLALANDAPVDALKLAVQAVASARSERSADPIKDRYSIAAEQRLLGDVRRRLGDPDGAKAAWTDGLAPLPTSQVERPWEMNERAELLRRLDRTDEARPIVAKLVALGFKASN
ncbi:toll/interleukin-1 receptor domain-containing protein [Sphingomonas sp.]|uniref:toll/interleukin-1 receptor domain-containing protein n=1 Tax=Sphingomonas sp. TaxID=28214 RepID=UPI002869EE92|nr:toll/interleukin-1 receptor domain-containing protein [Sphingomonas sp.]